MWSRGIPSLRSGLPLSRRLFSASAQSQTVEIDDFLHAVSSVAPQAIIKNKKVLETANEFSNWLDQNPVKTIAQLSNAAQLVINVKSDEQKKAFSLLEPIVNKFLPKCYEQLGPNEIIDAMRFLSQINPGSVVLNDLQKKFVEKNISTSDLLAVPFETLVMFIRYSNASMDQEVLSRVADVLILRMEKELGNAADLLAILAGGYDKSKWFHNEKFIKAAEKLVPVMGISQKCVLLKHMATHKQRNRQLLGAIVNSISSSAQCLTVSQIVSVTSSCSSLTYYPPKISRKIAEDLEKNSNILQKWEDVISICSSFVRMRMGNEKSWNILIRWGTENVKQARTDQLSRFVSGLARMGEPAGKPLANALKPLLKRERVSTPSAWLNIVYSLAYFQELDQVHADSVLNKNFVEQIMSSAMEVHDRLRKAMMLLMISSAATVDMQGKYEGPTVNKSMFAQFGINFDAKTIRNARQLKYSSNASECESVFLKSLFKLAPQDTHCQPPNVEECGAFVDAYVLPDQKSGLLVSKSQWNDTKPTPLFYYGWMQTKQNTDSKPSELNVMGTEQLGLRLIRASGYDPVIVFLSEFEYCSTDIDKVNMLREKIHKRN